MVPSWRGVASRSIAGAGRTPLRIWHLKTAPLADDVPIVGRTHSHAAPTPEVDPARFATARTSGQPSTRCPPHFRRRLVCRRALTDGVAAANRHHPAETDAGAPAPGALPTCRGD